MRPEVKELEFYNSLENLPLYNWNKLTTINDYNWLIVGFDGRQTKVKDSRLEVLAIQLQDDYFKLLNDRSFTNRLQKMAKIDNLSTRYNIVTALLQRMSLGFADCQMETRYQFIEMINKFGFNMPQINTVDGDIAEIVRINSELQNIKTQIKILNDELKVENKGSEPNLNKQLILIGLGLGLNYRLNPKEITVSEYVEMCKLLEEKSKQN
jgi:hypothetical protein